MSQPPSAAPSIATSPALLAHVTFHHAPERRHFLAALLRGFADYQLPRILVVVDSNDAASRELLAAIPSPPHVQVRVDVHDQLPHPYELAWAHRAHMARAVDEFDAFLYLEDDIQVPWAAFARWHRDAAAVDQHGFVLGFLRVERSREGQIVACDWREPLRHPEVLRLGDLSCVRPEAFYHGCWAATRAQLRSFLAARAWTQGFHSWSSVTREHRGLNLQNYRREFAAFGMACARAGRPRLVLPLGADGQVDPDAHIWHLANNYAPLPQLRLPTADRLLAGRPASWARRALLPVREGLRWIAHWLRIDSSAAAVRRGLRSLRARLRSRDPQSG